MVATFMAFWILIPKLATKPKMSLDTDWFYRKPFKVLLYGLVDFVCAVRASSAAVLMSGLRKTLPFFANPVKWAPQTVQEEAIPVYDEDRYRFPIGVTVVMSLLVFVVTISYIWLG